MAAKMNSKTKQRKIRSLKRRDGPSCRRCRRRFTVRLRETIHHIIPVRHGGTNELINLILLCDPCHRIIET